MGIQTLDFSKADDIPGLAFKGGPGITYQAGFFDKSIHRKRGRKSCCAGRRKNVVWPCDVISYGLRRIISQKYGAGIAYLSCHGKRIFDLKLKMLGCNLICKFNSRIEV